MILHKGKAPSNEGAVQGVPWRLRHGGIKHFRYPGLQAVAMILRKGKAPSNEGAVQGVPWRLRHGGDEGI